MGAGVITRHDACMGAGARTQTFMLVWHTLLSEPSSCSQASPRAVSVPMPCNEKLLTLGFGTDLGYVID